jgi:hypothetical protein
MDYKGVNIPKKVIIVAKPQTQWFNYMTSEIYTKHEDCSPAYVVDPSSKGMLESALSWASSQSIKLDENGNPIKYINQWNREEIEYEKLEGIQYEYDNDGIFDFELEDSANGSCQGGKLSFWNCKITAPDGNKFLIGINSDILLNLLKHNTFINGKCQSKVYLGRIKGNAVGAFTENMELFEQAKHDDNIRNASKSKKYIPGDVIRTKTETFVYIGEIYKNFETFSYKTGYWNYRDGIDTIHLFDKPKKYHMYIHLYSHSNFDKDDNIIDIEKGSIRLLENKQSYILCNKHVEVLRPYEQYLACEEENITSATDKEYYKIRKEISTYQFSNTENSDLNKENLQNIINKGSIKHSNILRNYTCSFYRNNDIWSDLDVLTDSEVDYIKKKYKDYNTWMY